MDLLKKVKIGSLKIEDKVGEPSKILLLDIQLSPSLGSYCQVRLNNSDGAFNGKIKAGADIEIEVALEGGFIRQFTGVVMDIFDAAVIRIVAGGNSEKLKGKPLKKGFNKIQCSEILKFILKGTGLSYEVGKLPAGRRHSYSIAGGTAAEELLRLNENFGLEFIPFFNKAGKLIFKTAEENVAKTKISFDGENISKFEDGTFEAPLTTGLDIFDEVLILETAFVITYTRILIDEVRSRIIFAAEKA